MFLIEFVNLIHGTQSTDKVKRSEAHSKLADLHNDIDEWQRLYTELKTRYAKQKRRA